MVGWIDSVVSVLFPPHATHTNRERQDSVFNGFSQTKKDASVVCIHDSARPLVSQEAVLAVRKSERQRERKKYVLLSIYPSIHPPIHRRIK